MMAANSRATHRRWLRIATGGALLLASVIASVHAWDALFRNHPAYPASLLLAAVVGIALIGTGWVKRPAPPAGVMRRIERVAAAIGGLAIAGVLLWLQPALATDRALDALASDPAVTISDSRSQTVYEPATAPSAGLVLYPGGKVDPRAYAVIARGVAERGYRVVVPKCAFDLALLCENAASASLTDDIPWAVGGHSLGGVAASSFAANGTSDGLVLFASFPVSDVSGVDDLTAISIYGSRDGLSTPDDIADRRDLLPPTTRFIEIDGAIHDYFGDYGPQSGDGVPTVSRPVAQAQIIDEAAQFMAALSADNAVASRP